MVDAYGTDVSTYSNGDLDPSFSLISGVRVIAEGLARRFETPRGTLIGDRNYGTDLRPWLNTDFLATDGGLFTIKVAIEDEAEKDERVQSAVATVSYSLPTRRLSIRLAVTTALGPFTLKLSVSAVTVELLSAA